MIIKFRNNTLRKNYEDVNEGSREWGHQVARSYVKRIDQIEAMPTFHGLFSISSLRLHPLKGNRQGQYALTLTGRYRLIIERDEDTDTVLVSEVSNHYDD